MQVLHDLGLPATFAPYTLTHGVVVAATGVTVAGLVVWRRRLGDESNPTRQHRFDRVLAVGLAAIFLICLVRELMPDRISWEQSIPLHVCDWAMLSAILAFGFNWRPARTFLHYAGLTLSTQAYITPVLTAGPAYTQFYLSWLFHGAIMVAALVDLLSRHYRPGWDDFRTVMRWGTAYLLLVFPLDAIFGWNYGYVGPTDAATASRARTLGLFGPWPIRVPIMYGAACAAFALMTFAWNARALLASRTPPHPAPDAVS